MSTRGAWGFRYNGKEKIIYNRYDSYLHGLGQDILDYLKGKTVDQLIEYYNSIEFDDTIEMADAEFNNLPITFTENVADFLYDSFYCEYAYIINLDDMVLEYYTGYNKCKFRLGRYAGIPSPYEGYYGVSLEQVVPLKLCMKGDIVAGDIITDGKVFIQKV